MASLCLVIGTFSQKVIIPTIKVLFSAILAWLWSIIWMHKMEIYFCL